MPSPLRMMLVMRNGSPIATSNFNQLAADSGNNGSGSGLGLHAPGELQEIREARKRLELELLQVQQQTKVAELNARATELEFQIEGLTSQLAHLTALGNQGVAPEPVEDRTSDASVSYGELEHPVLSRQASQHRFTDWQQLLDRYGLESPLSAEQIPRDSSHYQDEVTNDEPAFTQATFEVSKVSDDEAEKKRRRPLSFVLSLVVHALLIFLFAMVTFASTKPKDQVALSASTASESSVEMETFSFESIETETETDSSEPIESPLPSELSPLGEPAMAPLPSSVVSAPPNSMASMMQSGSSSSASLMSKPSNSDAKMEFCGLDGGGNHFVYLVDSSGSMGAAFQSARMELLRSIDQLEADQKFYVIFFDSEPDFMRLSNPNQDEPRSVFATPKNKAAVQAWAMRITIDRGRNPNALIDFVLDLRADAIFLLSDGEFPQTTEDMFKEKNRRQNLFGDGGIISIVHTIAYHSRVGESRMRRIADQNEGQYRYIPRPK